MTSKKITGVLVAFASFAAMFIATIYLLKWGNDNDIPVLEDAYDVIS